MSKALGKPRERFHLSSPKLPVAVYVQQHREATLAELGEGAGSEGLTG